MSTKPKPTHRQVIDTIGLEQLAIFLGIDRAHVRQMRIRDRIPDHHWNGVVRAANAAKINNISLQTLADASEAKARGA